MYRYARKWQLPLCVYSVGETPGTFLAIVHENGEKQAFQKGDFSANFSPMFKESASGGGKSYLFSAEEAGRIRGEILGWEYYCVCVKKGN
jgi:hypothetical protein